MKVRLSKEICSVIIPQRKKDDIIFEKDEFIKSKTTIEIKFSKTSI